MSYKHIFNQSVHVSMIILSYIQDSGDTFCQINVLPLPAIVPAELNGEFCKTSITSGFAAIEWSWRLCLGTPASTWGLQQRRC